MHTHYYQSFNDQLYTSTRATITNLLYLYVITMPASFRLLVDELTHGTTYPLTL